MEVKVLLDEKYLQLVIRRLACQIIEKHDDLFDTVLLGLQPRGIFLADRIKYVLQEEYHIHKMDFGYLDATFFRDDFRRKELPMIANQTQIDFLVEDKKVILIDDVLYSGRSVRAGLAALQSFGRPLRIELMVLIDRRFSRELPIQPDYKGRQVDAINSERVEVKWKEVSGKDEVHLVNY